MVALASLTKAMASLNQGASVFSSGLSSIQGLFSGITSAISSAAATISTEVGEAFQGMKDFWNENIAPLWDDLSAAADTALTAISEFFAGVELPNIFTSEYWLGEEGVFTKIGNWMPDFDTAFSFETPAIFTSDYWFGEDGVFTKIGAVTFDFLSMFSFELPDPFPLLIDFFKGEGAFAGLSISDRIDLALPDLPSPLSLLKDFFLGEGAFGNLTLSDRIDLVIGNLPQPLKFIKDLFDGTLFATIADFINLDIDWETFKTNAIDAVSGIVDGFADLVKGPINLVIEALNSVFSSIKYSQTIDLPGLDPYTVGIDLTDLQIPMLAKGGIVTGPTLAMIGEAGPEAVVPLDGKNAPGGQTFNITVNPSGITDRSDKREMAREIGNLIQQEVSRALGGTTMRGRM